MNTFTFIFLSYFALMRLFISLRDIRSKNEEYDKCAILTLGFYLFSRALLMVVHTLGREGANFRRCCKKRMKPCVFCAKFDRYVKKHTMIASVFGETLFF